MIGAILWSPPNPFSIVCVSGLHAAPQHVYLVTCSLRVLSNRLRDCLKGISVNFGKIKHPSCKCAGVKEKQVTRRRALSSADSSHMVDNVNTPGGEVDHEGEPILDPLTRFDSYRREKSALAL